MKIKIKDIDINYIQYGKGKDIVLLHGWGQNIEMMKPLGDKLEKNYRITILDLPGFGESSEPREALTVGDYNIIVEQFLEKLEIKSPIVMGHSFGGRIAMIYASENKTEKLVLFGVPCIKRIKKDSVKVKVLKGLKKIPGLNKLENIAKSHIGSRDYRNASDIMRKILVNTVNEDLSENVKKINCPTLLIWGDNDEEVPVEEAKIIADMLKDSGLIILDNSTHYAYLENLNQVTRILNKFI